MKLILLSFFFLNLIAINCAYWNDGLAGDPGIIKCRLKIWVLYFMKLKGPWVGAWKRKTTHQLPTVMSAFVAEMGQHYVPCAVLKAFLELPDVFLSIAVLSLGIVLQKTLLPHHNLCMRGRRRKQCFSALPFVIENTTSVLSKIYFMNLSV